MKIFIEATLRLARRRGFRNTKGTMGSNSFHVLLVEDDERDARLLNENFQTLGLPDSLAQVPGVDAAIDYLQGREPYQDRKRYPLPALILISLPLSRRAEFKMLKWLRGEKSLRSIPVVVLANSREPIGFEQASEFGAVSYLIKPIETQALHSLVKAVVSYWMLNEV